MALFYALRHRMSGAIFVKEADFFEAQGGLTASWGKKWCRVEANSLEEARQLVEREVAKNPDAWPSNSRSAPVLGRETQLQQKVDKAVEAYNRLSPEEKKAHDDAQRESWVRGEMAISKAEREEGRHTRVMRESRFKSRFGHHPDPVIDYEVEVGELEAELIDLRAGLDHAMAPAQFRKRLYNALDFNVATPEGQRAKHHLREKVEREWGQWVRDNSLVYPNRKGEFIVGQHLRGLGAEPPRVAPKVPEGQTPLDRNLKHRLLDVIDEGKKARDTEDGSPYHGHSLEHCLHATGWVYRDLQIALNDARAEIRRLEEKLAAVREKLND